MIIDTNENISIITQEKVTVIELVKKIEALYPKFENQHIIVQLTSLKTIVLEDVIEFLRLSKLHKGANKSFVIVSNTFDISLSPDEIIVVPTRQEAKDVIEMEDMERDLGI
ncbi:ribonuclease Z [Aurantibacter sp.]|uniref:ribonuclease Z n=1 Tax=Aurantibacter sp. TaxID=2807103 RepID=UPI0035C78F63